MGILKSDFILKKISPALQTKGTPNENFRQELFQCTTQYFLFAIN